MLPPVFVCGCAFWLGAALGYGSAQNARMGALLLASAGCLFLGLLLAVLWFALRNGWALALVSLCVGMLWGLHGGLLLLDCAGAVEGGIEAGGVSAVLLEDSKPSGEARYAYVRTEDAQWDGIGVEAPIIRVRLPLDAVLLYGERVALEGSVTCVSGKLRDSCWEKGCVLQGRAVRAEGEGGGMGSSIHSMRKSVVETVSAMEPKEASGVLCAMVCGCRVPLEESDIYQKMQTAGIAHLVAVSGAHLSLVCGLMMALFRRIGLGKRPSYFFYVAFIFGYLLFAAIPVSSIRAAIMVLCGISAFWFGRRPASLNALGICIFGMIAFSVETAVSVSFLLSAGSTIGIVLFGSLVKAKLARFMKHEGLFVETLAITLASNITTMPVSAAIFNQVPLASPIANAIAGPLFPLACGCGFVGACLLQVFPLGAGVAFQAALAATRLLNASVGICSKIPFACVSASVSLPAAIVATLGVSALLYARWNQPLVTRRLVVPLASVFLAAGVVWAIFGYRANEVVAFDVGQGDAILVRSHGHAVLIDTGNQEAKLKQALARNGIFRLDAVFVTHPDDDHCGCLGTVASTCFAPRVILSAPTRSCESDSCVRLRATCDETFRDIIYAEAGQCIEVGAFKLHVIWPFEFIDEGGNADSLCILLTGDVDDDGHEDIRALLCGDAEASTLAELSHQGHLKGLDVLKVGHHGSKNALNDALAESLDPAFAIVSVGAQNRYGHPALNTLEYLERMGAKILRTDELGDIRFKVKGDGVSIAGIG